MTIPGISEILSTMKNLLFSTMLALAAGVCFTPASFAFGKTFGLCIHHGCCNKCCCGGCNLCIRQYNAFSPCCFGTIYCNGCMPLGGCGPGGGLNYCGMAWGSGGMCGAACAGGACPGGACLGELPPTTAPLDAAAPGAATVQSSPDPLITPSPLPKPLPPDGSTSRAKTPPNPVQAAGYQSGHYQAPTGQGPAYGANAWMPYPQPQPAGPSYWYDR